MFIWKIIIIIIFIIIKNFNFQYFLFKFCKILLHASFDLMKVK